MVDKLFPSCKAFIVFNGKILILRESSKYEDGAQFGKVDVPGGRVKLGERFDEGLIREIKEETGLSVKLGNPFCVSEWRPKVRGEEWQVVATFFECFSENDKVVLSGDHDKYLWINPKEYLKYNIIETNYPVFEAFLKR